jgi:hypothetical protein
MIQQLSIVFVLAGGLLFIVFCFVDYMVGHDNDCQHEHKTTYNSYHKQVCVDCLQEFQIEEE